MELSRLIDTGYHEKSDHGGTFTFCAIKTVDVGVKKIKYKKEVVWLKA